MAPRRRAAGRVAVLREADVDADRRQRRADAQAETDADGQVAEDDPAALVKVLPASANATPLSSQNNGNRTSWLKMSSLVPPTGASSTV